MGAESFRGVPDSLDGEGRCETAGVGPFKSSARFPAVKSRGGFGQEIPPDAHAVRGTSPGPRPRQAHSIRANPAGVGNGFSRKAIAPRARSCSGL